MKLLLPSVLVVAAATLSAAELKEPAAVEREWQRMVESVPPVSAPPVTLREMNPAPLPFAVNEPTPIPAWETRSAPAPFEGTIRPPGYQEGKMPRGAKPYDFDGETYWIIPLATRGDA